MIGYLVLENGEIFEGERIGYNADTACEVVFDTAMSGYIGALTDPSVYGEGIVMTYPLIGNYGIIPEDYESDNAWAKALFIHELTDFESNFRSKFNLEKFLRDYKIPGLSGVNTRKLTKMLRDEGTMRGYITSNINNIDEIMKRIKEYEIKNAIERVTSKEIKVYGKGKSIKVALIDYGFKHSIANALLKRGVEVTVFPANTPAEKILEIKPNGILLSNGPGNPNEYTFQIENVKKLCETNIPMFGICLGHLIMGLANGLKTGKLKYGHRGGNHPVKDLKKDRVYSTAQGHDYYILEENVDKKIAEISHISMSDGTVEGLRYKNKKIFTVQFHPEACPGPEDTEYLFDEFIDLINK